MKPLMIALVCMGGVAGAESADAATLRWYGQACFEIASDKGARVVIDPFAAQVGYPVPKLDADLVLITHEHGDHNNAAAVAGKPEVLHGLQMGTETHTVGGITARAVRTAHDDQGGKQRGMNTIFVVKVDGITFAHCGDLGHTLTPEQVKAVGAVDVLMIPVGGYYTIDAAGAAHVIGQVKPKLVVPMHFRTEATPKLPISGLEAFEAAAKAAKWPVKHAPKGALRVTRAGLPKATTVEVLEYQ